MAGAACLINHLKGQSGRRKLFVCNRMLWSKDAAPVGCAYIEILKVNVNPRVGVELALCA